MSASEAIAWGRAQADIVLIKPGDSLQHYSAGHRHPGGEDLPVWPQGKELERRRDPRHAYLDRPAGSPAILWRVKYSFSLTITDLARFAEQYRLGLQRDQAIEAVEDEATETEGAFIVRASTSTEARENAIEATERAWKTAWKSLSEPPRDAYWISSIDDPQPFSELSRPRPVRDG